MSLFSFLKTGTKTYSTCHSKEARRVRWCICCPRVPNQSKSRGSGENTPFLMRKSGRRRLGWEAMGHSHSIRNHPTLSDQKVPRRIRIRCLISESITQISVEIERFRCFYNKQSLIQLNLIFTRFCFDSNLLFIPEPFTVPYTVRNI